MKYKFFLGGHDAEMLEIKNILQSKNIHFVDKDLKWGAKLSEYDEEIKKLSQDEIPVFIELTEDKPFPTNAIIIDHHGKKSGKNKKTSIDQVADLLKIELNRHQQLISINDRSHIRGMREFGATEEEIQKIRSIDRQAQGVTKKDESLALKSINERSEVLGDDIIVINSLCERSSVVWDFICGKYLHTVIYSPDGNFHYSGPGNIVKTLVELFEKRQKKDPSIEFWYGGALPDYGFVGSSIDFKKEEIVEVIKNSIQQ